MFFSDPSLGLVLKLIDLDSAKLEGHPVGSSALTHAYCAPELARATLEGTLADCAASPKHDSFSLGLVFVEVFTGSHLLQAEMDEDARTQPSSASYSKVRPVSAGLLLLSMPRSCCFFGFLSLLEKRRR